MKRINAISLVVMLTGLIFAGCHSSCCLKKQATVTQPQAEATALAKVPNGTIKEAELEKEKGILVWSFDISTPGTKDITEVQVDAKTGQIVSTEIETEKDQASEK